MDQTLINWMLGLLCAAGGWWMKAIWEGLKALEVADRALVDRVAAIDLLVAGQYVKRDVFEARIAEFSNALFKKLDKIEDKLDHKVDRAFHP